MARCRRSPQVCRMRVHHCVVLLAGVAACAPLAGSDPGTCKGTLTFIVSNRSNRDVDVVANMTDGAPVAIGTVRAGGNEELMLPKGARSASTQAAREGATVVSRGRVDTRYSCRP